jgi:phosphoglycerate dehydrogenase-like enzyme
MSWNVLITAGPMNIVGQAGLELLRSAGCRITEPPRLGFLNEEELLAVLPGVDAVLAGADKYSARVLDSEAASALKIISRWGVGFDAIDIPQATAAGIVVANTPGLLDEGVADWAFALLCALARRLPDGVDVMRRGAWEMVWGTDIHGKTLGIIGCGRIGQAMARRAAGFNLQLLGCDLAPSPAAEKLGVKFVPLEELLAQSDFVSLHAALTPQNRGLIGETQLRAMKPGALLINTARGALVDEAVLVRALNEGWIGGAALDAYAVEPLPQGHPLRTAKNALLTPHIASYGRDTGARVSLAAAQAIVNLLQGRRPQFVVNPDVFSSASLRQRVG